jgi:phage terminase small subunit
MATTAASLQDERRRARTAPGVLEWLQRGGWHAVKGTAHRGVLHPDEYLDEEAVRAMFERELGFTVAQVRSVHRQGRTSKAQRELRTRVDARLLAISRAGGNMTALAGVVGLQPKSLQRALSRASQTKEAA